MSSTIESGYGLHDQRLYDRGFPYEWFRRLRDDDPVSHHEHPDYEGGFWVVARHADVQAVSRASATWRNAPSPLIETPPGQPTEPAMDFLLDLDGSDHARMRRIVSRAFTPRRVADLEDRLRQRLESILDSLRGRAGGDLVQDFAMWLPLHVISDIVGVPESDRLHLFELAETLAGFDARATVEERESAGAEILQYALDLCQQRQDDPGDDVLSLLMTGEIDGERLSSFQLGMFFLLLLSGGADTTRNLTAAGTVALLKQRHELERLQSNLELMPSAVEELLRYTTPVMYFCRQAVEDTVVAGVEIPAGDRVLLSFPSANRDGRIFDEPDRLDITRSPNDHLAFGGGGPHFCLGAALARVEGRLIFEAIATRFENLELTADPATLPRPYSNIVDGFAEVPVTWSAIR